MNKEKGKDVQLKKAGRGIEKTRRILFKEGNGMSLFGQMVDLGLLPLSDLSWVRLIFQMKEVSY